jgi:hypothetical protein
MSQGRNNQRAWVAGWGLERATEMEAEAHASQRQRTARSRDAWIERIRVETTLRRAAIEGRVEEGSQCVRSS